MGGLPGRAGGEKIDRGAQNLMNLDKKSDWGTGKWLDREDVDGFALKGKAGAGREGRGSGLAAISPALRVTTSAVLTGGGGTNQGN